MVHHLQQQLQQQQDESQAQALAQGPDRASVGCQTRQGDSWRVHSQRCMGKSGQESGSWANHGVLHAWLDVNEFDLLSEHSIVPVLLQSTTMSVPVKLQAVCIMAELKHNFAWQR